MPKQEKVKVNVKERIDDNTIDLSLSELTEVPIKDIAAFKRVVNVDLSNNKIISLGKNISLLSHITKLDLSKNELKYLPDDFGSLKSLRHLDLYNNRLEHLPLSFGNLQNLRYLDLKANPLTPTLAKIVGPCLTTKDCNESAKNTVKFLKEMLIIYENGKNKLKQEELNENQQEQQIDTNDKNQQKSKKKKNKSKSKKSKTNQQQQQNDLIKENNMKNIKNNVKNNQQIDNYNHNDNNSRTALTTIFIFFFLLAINIFVIYILTVKNPEIAEKLAEIIPEKYRNIILSKTENLKINFFRISDYLQQFRTPPEDNYYLGGKSM